MSLQQWIRQLGGSGAVHNAGAACEARRAADEALTTRLAALAPAPTGRRSAA